MASITQKQTSFNISNTVANAVTAVRGIRSQDASRKELEFQVAVASGLSYSDQIKFRERQIEDAEKSSFPDADFITNLTKSLATTKQLSRFAKVRELYKKSLNDYQTGKSSLESYASVLESELDLETDPTMRAELSTLVFQANTEKTTNDLNAIRNRASIALKDKSVSVVESSISEIKSKRALASINNNQEEMSMWDQTIQSLNGVKGTLQIENATNELNFKITKNNPKANDKLSYLNDIISGADSSEKIIYNNVEYPSLKAFWENKRDDYIANSYFDEADKDMAAENLRIAATSKFGQIPTARIQAVSDFFNKIKTRPEFAPYADQIEQRRVESVSKLTTDLAGSLYEEADQTGNNAKAQTAVLGLEQKFGVNVQRQAFGGEGTIANEAMKKTDSSITPEATINNGTGGMHTVTQGENLSAIASKNGISLLQLLDANPEYKKNPSMVNIGASLKLPTSPTSIKQETAVAPIKPVTPETKPANAPAVKPTMTPPATNTPAPTQTQTPTQTNTPAPTQTTKTFSSVTDLFKSKGMDSSYAARAKVAAEKGISNYTGTAEQNRQLINKINV